jgi:cytochrome P450
MRNRSDLPAGPRGLPLLGNVLPYRHDLLEYLLKLEQNYGRMATIYIGRTPVVLFFRPEHVRYLLVENPRNFTNREVAGGLVFGKLLVLSLLSRNLSNSLAHGLHELIGDNVITTDGDFHDRHRALFQPAFSKARVRSYANLIVRYTQELLQRWQPDDQIDFVRQTQSLILRIIMKIIVDVDVNGERVEVGALIEEILEQPASLAEGLLNLRIDLPITPYGRRMAAKRRADAYVHELIQRRLEDKHDVGDVLSILLGAHGRQNEGGLTIPQVRDELLALVTAGYETTTNSIAWTYYLLGRHPAVLQKVVAELERVLAGRTPQVDDLPRLTYFEHVIKESMRLYPSAWTQGRQAVEAFDLDGYHFPAGTMIMFSQWVLHRLPDIWTDPHTFRPERWDLINGEDIYRWAYFPFGRGSRICLGTPLAELEIRLILATILQQYVPTPATVQPVVPLPLITLRLKDGLPIKLAPAGRKLQRVTVDC